MTTNWLTRGTIESVVRMGTGSRVAGSQCSPVGGRRGWEMDRTPVHTTSCSNDTH